MMKYFLTVLIALTLLVSAAAAQAADVGVSVSVGQPGFYGHIDIGDFPRPQVIYAKPIVVKPPRVRVVEEPIYLHVPPGHAKKWSKHCHKYDACGRPVYFVKDRWYNDVYAARHKEGGTRHGKGHDRGHGSDKKGDNRGRGHDRD